MTTAIRNPLVIGAKVQDPREVKSEGGHVSPLDASDSMTSFKTARSTFSPPTSPSVKSLPAKKVFHIEGSVSEGDEEGDEEVARGRKVEREIAANVEEVKRLRRFHTFVELLKTEVGYLMDLRALVAVRAHCYCLDDADLRSFLSFRFTSRSYQVLPSMYLHTHPLARLLHLYPFRVLALHVPFPLRAPRSSQCLKYHVRHLDWVPRSSVRTSISARLPALI